MFYVPYEERLFNYTSNILPVMAALCESELIRANYTGCGKMAAWRQFDNLCLRVYSNNLRQILLTSYTKTNGTSVVASSMCFICCDLECGFVRTSSN